MSNPWVQPDPTQPRWVRLGWVGLNFFNLPSWIKLKNFLNPTQPDPCTLLLDVHAQDFHQKILKKKKNKNKNKTKQKATQKTLIFQVIGPAHKIKLIVYMHLIIHQRLFAFRPILCFAPFQKLFFF